MKKKLIHLPLLFVFLLIGNINAHHPSTNETLDFFNPNNTIVATSTSTTCGANDGTASVEVGLLPVALIEWSNGVSGQNAYTITGLSNGIYSVTVTAPPVVVTTSVIVGYIENNIIDASANMGSAGDDNAADIAETNTGGFISVGVIDGPAATYGGEDVWVNVRNHGLGNEWSRVYGGSADDIIVKVLTLDDGYMLAGRTRSIDGTVPSAAFGLWDIWLTKIDFTGGIQWSLKYGGNSTELLYDIEQTCDGGFIFVGASASTNLGQGNKGGYDYYACKITSTGAINWRTLIGGSFDDHASSVAELPNGNYAIVGFSESNDGDVSGNYSPGSWDIWLAELDNNGFFVGGRNYGGTGSDRPYDMVANQDNSVYIISSSNSNNGEAGNTVFGLSDYLLMRIETPSTGTAVLYTNKFGGSANDIPSTIIRTGDGGLLVGGTTFSNDGTIQSGNTGGSEYWLTKFTNSPSPTVEWEQTYGSNPGGFNDNCVAAIQASDGGYAMLGSTPGNPNFGQIDFWGIVLDQEPTLSVQFIITNTCGTNATGSVQADVSGGVIPYSYAWSNGGTSMTINNLPGGVYTVTITDGSGCELVASASVLAGVNPTISFSQTTSSCPGPAGIISSNVSGGKPPYSYLWSTGATTPNANGLEPGVVYLTVTDDNGCFTTANAIVLESPGKINAYIRTQETECSDNGGGAQAFIKNPSGSYIYQWSTGETTSSITNLPNGEVSVSIGKVGLGCKARQYYDIVQDSKSPTISWVQNFGGSNDDAGWDVIQTTDDNFIIAGQSKSNNGDVGGNYGDQDCWILKVDNTGGLAWEKNYGGTDTDLARSIIEADSSVYTFAGTSSSSDNDVSGNNGASDIWVANIDNSGGLNWEQNYGGSQVDDGMVIKSQTNNEYFVGGWSNSSNFDVPSNKGSSDYWMFTINQASDKIITKSNGGTSPDYLLNGIKTSDGGFMTIGYSLSSNFDVSANYGGTDVWLVKYNPFGNISWKQNYGGTGNDFGYQVIELKDCSGYAFVGYTESSNIDVGSNYGGDDVWVVKIDNTGGIVWEKNYGGTGIDQGIQILETGDYGFLVGGHTQSSDNDVSTNLGGEDFWLFKTDLNGVLQWEESYGGSNNERLLGMSLTKDGGYILTGFTLSNDGHVPGNNGMQDILVVKLIPTVPPKVTATSIDPFCAGSATGSIDVTVTKGEPPYTYIWNNGATTEDVTGLLAGNYIITVTEANGCSSGIGISLTNQRTVTINTTVGPLACGGDGFINITTNGAVAPITYNWSNGATTQNISNLNAGIYSVTVTDRDGCTATASETLTGLVPFVITGTGTDVSCFGGSDGVITAMPTGGTPPYTYQWSANAGSQITPTATGLTAGTYDITVIDNNGCVNDYQHILNQPSEVITTISVNTATQCNTASGSATALVSGGVNPYTILWPSGGNGPTNTQLPSGWNVVTVTDSNGCQDTTGFNMPTQFPPVINAISSTDATCGQNNGTATVSGAGTPPIGYIWSNGGNSATIANLGPGTYTVTVTDNSFCSATAQVSVSSVGGATVVVDQANDPVCGNNGSIFITTSGGTSPYTFIWSNGATTEDISNIPGGTHVVTVTDGSNCATIVNTTLNLSPPVILLPIQNNVQCNGDSTGNIFVQLQGGTTPVSYIWSTGATTKNLNNIPAGIYSQTATDANGCTASFSATITEPPAIVLSLTELQPATCGNSDGSAQVQVSSGGVTPFQYLWSNTATTPIITGLAGGTYTVTVTDNGGCTQIGSINVNDQGGPTATALSIVQPACGNNGSVTISVTGGTNPYSYNWSNGATTPNLTGLAGGTYFLTVTDNNGCTGFLTAALVDSPPLVLTSDPTDLNCNNDNSGAIDLIITGGSAPISTIWSTGATTEDISGLASGNYQVTVSDANGCTATLQTPINQPPAINLQVNELKSSTCGNSDGEADALALGGTPPFQYLWSTGATTTFVSGLASGNYTITATDNNGCIETGSVNIADLGGPIATSTSVVQPACANNGSITISVTGGVTPYSYNWSNGATTSNLSGLAGGTYFLTVTDNNGCTGLLTEALADSPPVTATSVDTDLNCNNDFSGAIDLTVNTGVSPYSFMWSMGATTEDITGLATGGYSVTITDANGCTETYTTALTEPPAINLTVSELQPTTCGNSDGEAQAIALGGTTPFQYIWNTGETTATITGKPSGNYTITVTDNNGCTETGTTTINDLGGPAFTSVTTIDPSCDNDGIISVTQTGGVPPYSYNWSNGGSSPSISGLAPGNYSITVTDASSCNAVTSMTLNAPLLPSGIVDLKIDVLCFGDSDGVAGITVTGGLPPYTYLWSNGETTQSVSNLTAGMHLVTFTDDNNCSDTLSVTIISPSELIAVATSTPSTCGSSNGSVSVTASGSLTPYFYFWNTGATTATITGLPAATYTVEVSDVNGCIGTDIVIITDVGAPTGTITNVVNPSCLDDGSMSISVNGGSTPYSYNWSTGATTTNITGLSAGNYFVTVLDASGCVLISSQQLTAAPLPVVSLLNAQDISCNGAGDGFINLQISSGTTPYSFNWTNGASSQNISNLTPGLYTVTVTDGASCTATFSQFISEPPVLSAAAVMDNLASCGNSDGQASASATGGTSPYQYIWNNGATTGVNSGLFGGNYSVTVIDANLCEATASITIGNTSPPDLMGFVNNDPDCGASNGTITVLASGSQNPLMYSIDNGTNYQTSNFFTNLGPGFYTLIVKDNLGCTDSDTTSLFSGGAPIISSVNTVSPICQDSSGSIDIIATPPTGLNYSIDGGVTTQTTSLFSGLPSGTYYIVVEDQNGCQGLDTITLTDIAGPIISNVTITEPNCAQADGAISISATGGTNPLTYSIDGGTTFVSNFNFQNLLANTYNIVVQDDNGCKAFDVAVLSDQAGVVLDSVTVTDSSCDSTSGNIVIHASGNFTPFLYSIDGSNFQPSNTFTNVAPGQYTAMVVDTNNCQGISVVDVNYNAPPNFVLLQGISDTYCGKSIGSIAIVANGGTPPLEYALNGSPYQSSNTFPNLSAGFYTLMVRDSNGCEITKVEEIEDLPGPTVSVASTALPSCGQSDGSVTFASVLGVAPYEYSLNNGPFTNNNTFSNLSAGAYTVIVSDLNDCRDTLQFTLTDIPPPSIDLISSTDPTCGNSNGSITITASGASPPFNYAITGYPAQGSNVFNNLPPNTYVVTVRDAKGCTATDQVTLTDQGAATITNYDVVQPTCGNSNGSITVQTTGGTNPLLFSMNSGPLQISNVFNNLSAATYNFTVQDSNGCITTGSYQLQDIPGPTIDTVFIVDPACNQVNGSITINVSSGTAPFDYSIDNGINYQSSNQFNNLPDGTLTIIVKDANDCTANTTAILQDIPGPTITNFQTTDPDCGATNGEATVQFSAGTAPFSYAWSTIPSQQGQTAIGLAVGTYQVTVTDSNNCTAIDSAMINEPILPFVDLGPDAASCVPPNTFIDAMNIGADYIWSTGETTQTIDVLSYGTYIVTVTAVNGCTGTDEIEFTDSQYNPQVTNDTILFLGNSIDLQASGGDNYEWWPGSDLSCVFCADPVASPVVSTVYSVEISTVDGCVDTLQVEIQVDDEVTVPDVISPNGDGTNDYWVIPHIENFPFNRLTIVNRWGDVVFSANPYTNNWNGTMNGKPLPQGTYYYLLETDVNINNPKKGPITILK